MRVHLLTFFLSMLMILSQFFISTIPPGQNAIPLGDTPAPTGRSFSPLACASATIDSSCAKDVCLCLCLCLCTFLHGVGERAGDEGGGEGFHALLE